MKSKSNQVQKYYIIRVIIIILQLTLNKNLEISIKEITKNGKAVKSSYNIIL